MELKENNFNAYFKDVYTPVLKPLNDALDYINKHFRVLDKETLGNPTGYCYIALNHTIDYCKENDIKYYGSFLVKPERLIMLATETYLFDTYCLALDNLIEYTERINASKAILRQNPRINLLVNSNLIDDKKLATLILNNIEDDTPINNYNQICEILKHYDVRKGIPYAFEYFLPIFMESLNEMRITYNVDKNNEVTTSQLYYLIMSGLFNKLSNLEDKELMIEISKANTKAVSEYNEYVKTLKKKD